jgi:hypothetical protein
MARRTLIPLSLAVCLVLAACNSRPSSSGTPAASDGAALRERKAEYIEGLWARRGQAARGLAALTSVLPDRVWLTEVTFDAGKIRAKGRAATNNLLADYVTRLGESPSFTDMTLGGSVMKNVRGREMQEFAFEIALLERRGETAPSGASSAERLGELERTLTARQDSGSMLREIQGLARDAGLQMTKFGSGAETSGEFAAEVPVTVEVAGGLHPVVRYLEGLDGLPGLWVVERFTLRAAAPEDPRTPVRAIVTARAYFAR